MKKTTSFRIVAGVAPGYYHELAGVAEPELVAKVASLWQQLAAEEFKNSNIYITAVVSPAAVVYHQDWGCPVGGESVVKIEGSANPQFIENMDEYKNTVKRVALALKKELKQSTLSIEFWESEFVYLTD